MATKKKTKKAVEVTVIEPVEIAKEAVEKELEETVIKNVVENTKKYSRIDLFKNFVKSKLGK